MFLTMLTLFSAIVMLTSVGVACTLYLVVRYRIIDVPNDRSNHKAPIPRGAGLALIAVLIPSMVLLSILDGNYPVLMPILFSALILSLLSFIDDIRSLSVRIRLLAQLVAVAIGIVTIYDGISAPVFLSFLPLSIEMFIMGIAWLWFLNLYNFMDGIDGITACESFFIALGIIVISLISEIEPSFLTYWSVLIAGGSLGFYFWNKHPARIFLGDSGSILLGYLIGYMLLSLALNGQLILALLLPLYYLLDSTITIIKRFLNGEKIWQAHSKHYYQQAVRAGLSHTYTVLIIAVLNVFLILLASLGAYYTEDLLYFFMIGIALCSLVLNWFATYEQGQP